MQKKFDAKKKFNAKYFKKIFDKKILFLKRKIYDEKKNFYAKIFYTKKFLMQKKF